MAQAYSNIFSAVGVHSGLPAGSAQDIPQAFAAMRSGSNGKPLKTFVPTIVFHGLADCTVHPDNGVAVMSQAPYMPCRVCAQRHAKASRTVVTVTARRHIVTPMARSLAEHWQIDGAGHAWAGGHSTGSTDPKGPDASRQMVRFFLQHRHT